MGYNRINTPRVYTDLISQSLSNGWRDLDDITMLQDDGSTPVSFDSGTESDLYDLRPANSVKIAKENQSFYIQFNTGLGTNELAESNYLAILNHNFHSADVVFTVEIDDNASMSSATKVSTTANHTKLINADANNTAGEIDPAKNGWTLITWNTQESDNQYVRITFSDDNGADQNFNNDIYIGSIMYGEFFEFPNAPEIGVTTKIDYDGIKLNKSLGGNSYATATNFGQPEWASTLAWNNTSLDNTNLWTFNKRTGRINHSIKFNYLSDTDVWSNNSSSVTTSEWFDTLTAHNSFYNKVIGQFHPFLFSIDKDSTTEGDYGMFRLKDKSFKATQVSDRLWSIAFNIVETW